MGAERQPDTTHLDELAAEINRLHDAAISAVRTALQNAIEAGELLVSAKAIMPHGAWYGWLQDHTAVGVRQAQRYMKLYRERDKINASSATHLSSALEIVSAPKAKVVDLSAAGDHPPDARERLVDRLDAQVHDVDVAGIGGAHVPSTDARRADSLDRPVVERRQGRAIVHPMEDLMSVDGLYSLVSVWNSSGPDARRRFIELVNGDTSDILIER